MRKIFLIVILLTAMTSWWGCRREGGGPAYYGGGEEENVVAGSEVVGEIVPADTDVGEQVDEFAAGGEFSTTAAGTLEPTPAYVKGTETAPTTVTTSPAATTAEGYRVQVLASSFVDNANRVADQIRAAYPGVTVYVEHVQNLYKVRVGDYRDRASAEAMRDKLKAAGYVDAWIVKQQINVQ